MSVQLQDFFAGPALCTLMRSESIRRGIPDFLPPDLKNVSPSRPATTEIVWNDIVGQRDAARVIAPDSPSQKRQKQTRSKKTTVAIGGKEHITLGQLELSQLKSDVSFVRDQAAVKLMDDMADFREIFDALRVGLRYSALALGAIFIDPNGHLLQTNSGAETSVDFNTTHIFDDTSDPQVGDWSNSDTDISGNLRAIERYSIFNYNYIPRNILYGKDVPSFIIANTTLQQYMARELSFRDYLLGNNRIPNGFLGYQWTYVGDAYTLDPSGTPTQWFADDQVTIYPEVSPIWYEYFEGGVIIPKGIATPGMSMDQLIENTEIANGLFAYAELSTDPLVAKIIMGDYTLPLIKVGGPVFQFLTATSS